MMAVRQLMDTHPLHGPAFEPYRTRLRQNVDLSKTNWFRVGGPAEWLFKPESAADLSAFFALLPLTVPVLVLGVGSNVIVRDGGVEGVVIKLGRGFASIAVRDNVVEAGAAALDVNVAMVACEHGLGGLEFLSGIPGTIGGAVRMNGGAYGSDTSQVLIEAEMVERSGKIRLLSNAQCQFTYRHSGLPEGAVVTRAWFAGQPADSESIARRMQEIGKSREETQPVRSRTGGSTFKNPDGHKAWELIDRAGCRGLAAGDAQVSEMHCNFLINRGSASANDLEGLGEEVRRRVHAATGITLEWEIKRLGKHKGTS
jgi:UDP-N-acetylmuramate dehydrogenase